MDDAHLTFLDYFVLLAPILWIVLLGIAADRGE